MWCFASSVAGAGLRGGQECGRRRRPRHVARAGAGGASGGVPRSFDEAIDEASASVGVYLSGRAGGESPGRCTVTVPVPATDATDLDDYPGGVRSMFKALAPSVPRLLRGLGAACADPDACTTRWIDRDDAVAVWEAEGVVVVTFATSETLPALRALCDGPKAVVVVNPQWRDGDLGLGPWKQKNRAFLDTFASAYSLATVRARGVEMRVRSRHGAKHQVYVIDVRTDLAGKSIGGDGTAALVLEADADAPPPDYWALDAIAKDIAKKGDGGGGNTLINKLFSR